MIHIYTDGSFSIKNGIGTYCITIIDGDIKTYAVHDFDIAEQAVDVEYEAMRVACTWANRNKTPCVILSDCKEAIERIEKDLMREKISVPISLIHVKGHTIHKLETVLTDRVKYQHWCDTMAKNRLDERIIELKEIKS